MTDAPAPGRPVDLVAEQVAAAFDHACGAACADLPTPGVYVSPLWEARTTGPAEQARAWKRSVLRRVPGSGAEPWGHLFLVVLAGPRATVSLEGEAGLPPLPASAGPPLPASTMALREGDPRVLLLLRPRGPPTEEQLRNFAEAVRRRFSLGP